jgi:hypothetical protein
MLWDVNEILPRFVLSPGQPLPNAAFDALRTMKHQPKLGLPRLFDSPKYQQRHIIERMLG